MINVKAVVRVLFVSLALRPLLGNGAGVLMGAQQLAATPPRNIAAVGDFVGTLTKNQHHFVAVG